MHVFIITSIISIIITITHIFYYCTVTRWPLTCHSLPVCECAGWTMRIGFEASYCINTLTRFLTLPIRTTLPAFYIVGFPVSMHTQGGQLKPKPYYSTQNTQPYTLMSAPR